MMMEYMYLSGLLCHLPQKPVMGWYLADAKRVPKELQMQKANLECTGLCNCEGRDGECIRE